MLRPKSRYMLLVIDARYGLCHPGNIPPPTKHNAIETMRRIVSFREKLKEFGIPCLSLCKNRKVCGKISQWETKIIQSLAPSVDGKNCWRDEVLEGSSNKECNLTKALQKIAGRKEVHFLLCGFWPNNCISHVSTEALKRRIRSTIVMDCTYPLFNADTRAENIKRMKRRYPIINPSLLLFASRENILKNLSCAAK